MTSSVCPSLSFCKIRDKKQFDIECESALRNWGCMSGIKGS